MFLVFDSESWSFRAYGSVSSHSPTKCYLIRSVFVWSWRICNVEGHQLCKRCFWGRIRPLWACGQGQENFSTFWGHPWQLATDPEFLQPLGCLQKFLLAGIKNKAHAQDPEIRHCLNVGVVLPSRLKHMHWLKIRWLHFCLNLAALDAHGKTT